MIPQPFSVVSAGGKLLSPVSKLSVAVLHLAVSRLLMTHIPQLIITFAWFPELLLHVFGGMQAAYCALDCLPTWHSFCRQ